MKLFDITQTYKTNMKRYAGLDDLRVEWHRHYNKGSGMALSAFTMASHLGTHIDAPFHFIEQGKKTIDIPLETLCGVAQVVDARCRSCIDEAFLSTITITCPRVLFRTDNTELLAAGGAFKNVFLTPGACQHLIACGVLLVGLDYFSVDRAGDKTRAAHLALLEHDVVILEAVELAEVPPGVYELWCLPLKFRDLEGAPCRAVLRATEEETT